MRTLMDSMGGLLLTVPAQATVSRLGFASGALARQLMSTAGTGLSSGQGEKYEIPT